jgi:hypothetical protein
LDWAWITDRAPGHVTIAWRGVLVLAGLSLAAGLWLWVVMRSAGQRPLRRPALLWGVSLGLALLWLPVAVRTVQSVYLDPRFQPELGFLAAADIVRSEQQPDDLLITDMWTERLTGPAEAMLNYCQGSCPPRIDLIRETLVEREADWEVERLVDLEGYGRAWLVLDRVMEGDTNSIIEQWLGRVGYLERCQWTGPQVRLCLYSLKPGAVLQSGPIAATFGDSIVLTRAEVRLGGHGVGFDTASWETPTQPTQAAPGDTLQVKLNWQALAAPATNYNVSLQLLGPDGSLVTSTDRTPGNGFRPSAGWQAGEQIIDRFAVTVPANAAPGDYRLLVVVYDPATGQRLPVQLAGAPASDSLLLLELPLANQ